MRITKLLILTLLLLLIKTVGISQQLSLGNAPYTVNKAAVLELNSDRQGLLFPRINDTVNINTLAPPDGMVIYFVPAKQLMLRSNGSWKAMSFAASLSNYWSVDGNTNGTLKNFGTTDNYALPFITNNTERMRLTTGGLLGIGTSSPSTLLHVSGTNPLTLDGVQVGTTTSSDSVLTISSGLVKKLPFSTFQSQLSGTGFIKASGTSISYDNNSYTVANNAITGATKTKITYDSKGLVTAGEDATTSDIAEGLNLYHTESRVRGTALTGLSTATATAVTATDNLLAGIGKLQGQINALPTNSTALLRANNLSDLNSAVTARTNLGATTVGANFYTLTNPSAITFPRINADNTVSTLDAATYRSAIGAGTGNGTVTSASVVSANGFAGSVATSTTTPAITLATTVTGLLKGNGTAISAATAGTDYVVPNAAITGATKTKITYDAKGLVTSGADATTDDITEGSNQYFTQARVRTTPLTGYSVGINTALAATDDVLAAMGKIQAQINAKGSGSVTTFSSGGLSPLFSTSVANASSTPSLSFSLSNAGATSIFGNFTNASAAPSYNAATADGQFLVRRSGALTFGTIAASDIPTLNQNTTGSAGSVSGTNVITNANLRQSAGLSVVGNATSATANVADITAGTDGNVLRRNGTTLGFGTVATDGITNSAVTYSKIQNVSASNRLLGRATTGAGVVEEITIGSGLTLTGSTLSATGGSGSNWALDGNTLSSTQKLGTLSSHPLPFITNGTERMLIDESGNVGIGSSSFDTDAPEKLLIDAGATSSYNLIGAYGDRAGYLQFNIQNQNSGGSASTDIVATANNGTETTNYINMGINGGGYNNANNILSGPNNGYLFSAGRNFIIGNSSASYDLLFFTGGIASGNERMRILSGGNVGIGTASPSQKLHVIGNILASGTITQNSDRRLKTNVRSLTYGLKEVMNLVPVSYNWKEDSMSNRRIGFIAQEVRNIVPEVVAGDESRENLSMSYAELVPVLINAIKEQQQQIEDLKLQQTKDKAALKEMDELKQQMKEIFEKVQKLEKK